MPKKCDQQLREHAVRMVCSTKCAAEGCSQRVAMDAVGASLGAECRRRRAAIVRETRCRRLGRGLCQRESVRSPIRVSRARLASGMPSSTWSRRIFHFCGPSMSRLRDALASSGVPLVAVERRP